MSENLKIRLHAGHLVTVLKDRDQSIARIPSKRRGVTITADDAIRIARLLNDPETLSSAFSGGDKDQAEYWSDVRSMAESIRDKIANGDYADRDAMIEGIDQSIDGCQRVIYTQKAILCLVHSSNDSAGFDELGANGFNFKDGIPWSQLAYFAFHADVIEQLDAIGIDVNDPFKCSECDASVSGPDEKDGKCEDCVRVHYVDPDSIGVTACGEIAHTVTTSHDRATVTCDDCTDVLEAADETAE